MLGVYAPNVTAQRTRASSAGSKKEELHCLEVAPKCPRCQMCNNLNEMGVQGDVEEQEDVEVDAERQMNALLAPADCFPPIAAQRGRAAGLPSRRKRP